MSASEWRLPVPCGPNGASAGRRRASRNGQLSARGLSPEQTSQLSRPPPTSPPTATHSPCRVCQSCLSPPFVCLSIVLALALIHHHLPSYTYLPYLTLVHRTRPPSCRSRHTCLTPACLLALLPWWTPAFQLSALLDLHPFDQQPHSRHLTHITITITVLYFHSPTS